MCLAILRRSDLRKRDVSLAEKKESSRQDIETVYGHTHAWLCVVN